jgi:MobA/VirD2-like, nuclease domain
VIGKISARGSRVAGLLYYLYGPGRNEAHTDPHLVAGWREPAELEPALRQGRRRDFRHLAGLLQQPHAALSQRGFERPVWHCSIRTAPQDRVLSDSEWAQVAWDVMHRTGLAPHGQDDEAVRWVAIRHAPDHIHLVAVLARQDGTRPRFWNDYYRVGDACRAAEQRFGLRRTAPRDRTAGSRPTRAESEKTRRQGRSEPPRTTLRRAVSTAAAASSGEQEFFARLQQAGVAVRKRFSTRNPGQVTGYAVALPADTAGSGGPVWYSGGKLAPDLTLPKLRHRWNGQAGGPVGGPAAPLTPAERAAIWDHVTRTAAGAAEQIRQLSVTDPGLAADAAWAAADTLHAAASALGSRELRQAADSYARAARAPYGRVPHRTRAGDGLRRAARLLSLAAPATGDPVLAQIALIARLIALARAVADLRVAQRHAAQAAAARAAAGRLHTARCAYERRRPPRRAQGQAQAAREAFPFSIRDVLAREAATAHTRAPASSPRVSPAPATPRQRGPTG